MGGVCVCVLLYNEKRKEKKKTETGLVFVYCQPTRSPSSNRWPDSCLFYVFFIFSLKNK